LPDFNCGSNLFQGKIKIYHYALGNDVFFRAEDKGKKIHLSFYKKVTLVSPNAPNPQPQLAAPQV